MIDYKLVNIITELLGEKSLIEYPEDFKIRLLTQKILYILTHSKENPIELPYRWTFYIRGPYSSELPHMLYYISKFDINEIKTKKKFIVEYENKNEKAIKRFMDLSKVLFNNYKIDSSNAGDLEALATLLYIKLQIKSSKEDILKKFRLHKPEMTESYPDKKLESFLEQLEAFNYV